MQDRYAGDVGDFGKLGMLRKIADTGLKIGVNWYLTYKPEEHDNDGKHIGYLVISRLGGAMINYWNRCELLRRESEMLAPLKGRTLFPMPAIFQKFSSLAATELFHEMLGLRNH